jgi:flagellar biosynthesis protein
MADDPKKGLTEEDIERLLAVALEYDVKEDPAPKISAKGRGFLAQQIIEIARKHGVTIHRDADLAEILSVLDLESYIPLETYVAVAEIISYIYRKNAKLGKK